MTLKLTGSTSLHLPSYPASPVDGQLWKDTTTGTTWVYQTSTGTWRLQEVSWSLTIKTDAVTAGVATFSLITSNPASITTQIDWGDGQVESLTIGTGTVTTTHTYAVPGLYVVRVVSPSAALRPNFNNNAEAQKIIAVNAAIGGFSFGTSLVSAFYGAAKLTSVSADLPTSTVTGFGSTWRNCTSLASFPVLTVTAATSFFSVWAGCTSLTSFPLLVGISAVTSFNSSWLGCSALVSFPAGFFDTWTGTPFGLCFNLTWSGCTSLSATSVENILNSIDTSGRSGPPSGNTITIDYNAASGTPNITTAVTNLKARGWAISLNGVLQ